MTVSTSSPLVLVDDIGEPVDVDEWRRALVDAGWTGPVEAYVHPGRTGDTELVGGHHDVLQPAFSLPGTELVGPDVVLVALRRSGAAGLLLAVAGRTGALVLIDALDGPWQTPADQIAGTIARVRAIAADPAAVAPAPPGAPDPRLRHAPGRLNDRPTAERLVAAVEVPLLVLSTTGASPDLDALTDDQVRLAASRRACDVVPVLTAWVDALA